MSKVVYRIHPAIGIARVGDAADGWFVGPEVPGQSARRAYKQGARILRQGARFRVFAFTQRGGRLGPGKEIRAGRDGVVRVEWTVHLANRKATFFQFDGLHGEAGKYHDGVDMPERRPRNEGDPSRWIIDAGPKTITRGDRPVRFAADQGGLWPHRKGKPVIDYLGELRADGDRLIVLGGRGRSVSTVSPAATLETYANNREWLASPLFTLP